MGGKEMLSFVFIAGFLLSGIQVNAQDTTTGTAIESIVHISETLFTASDICSQIHGIDDLNRFLAEGFIHANPCDYTLHQYGCADVNAASSETLAKVLKCYLADQNAVLSQDALDKIIFNIGPDKFRECLNIFNSQVSVSSVTTTAKSMVLSASWKKFSSNPSILTPGFIAAWFQERLYGYLDDTVPNIIDSMTLLPLGCDSFEAFVVALNLAYSSYATDTRQLIGGAITRYNQAHSCTKATAGEFIHSQYGLYIKDVNYSDLKLAWSGIDVSGTLSSLTSFQVVQYARDINAFSSSATSGPILEFLQSQDFSYIADFAESISLLSGSSASFDNGALYSLLTLALGKFNTDDGRLCKSSLKVVFSSKFKSLLPTINGAALNSLPADMDCSEYQDIFYGINLVNNQFDETNQLAVFNYRYNFMSKQAEKTGSACTCDRSSQEWLEANFGYSLNFLSFAQILELNPSFDAFTSLEILTLNQTIDALIYHDIFTGVTVDNYESRVSAVTDVFNTRGYEYVEEFFGSLSVAIKEVKIDAVANENVRSFFLDHTWEIVSSHFNTYDSETWNLWFNEYLLIFLPSIKDQQLETLTWDVIADCSNFHIIGEGFDHGYGHTSDETKNNIAEWMTSILKQHTCAHEDWLNYYFYSYKEWLTVTTIKELDTSYDLIANLDQFSVTQITECVFYEESARTDVAVITQVFDAIISDYPHVEAVERLDVFWTEFNAVVTTDTFFEYDVQYTMLEQTTNQLEFFYTTYTENEFGNWFDKNLVSVVHTVNSTILEAMPLSISCGSFEKLTNSFNSVYEKTKEDNKKDVYSYLSSYLKQDEGCVQDSASLFTTILGQYNDMALFSEYNEFFPGFNVLDEGVINNLTPVQIGDAIASGSITTSVDNVNQVFDYLNTLTVAEVDTCFTQFTETAVKNNLEITNAEAGSALLNNYLNIVESQMSTYTFERIETIFSEEISVLLRFINEKSLSMLTLGDCNSLSTAVTHLDANYNYLPADILKETANWITGTLQTQRLGGCTEGYTTVTWTQAYFEQFFKNSELEVLKQIFTGFDFLTVIDEASVTQKVDYVITSDCLTNATSMQVVLESFREEDSSVTITSISEFFATFNVAYSELTNKNIVQEVQQEVMSFFFTSWLDDINFMTEEQRSEFGTWFQYVISGTDTALVEQIPDTVNCNSYSYLLTAFNGAFNHLQEEVQKSIADYILKFANGQQKSEPGNVCSNLYTDSRSYMEHFLFDFSTYESFNTWDNYYVEFDRFEVLDLCDSKQLVDVFFNGGAYQSEYETVQILVELKKRTEDEVSEFVTELNTVAQELHITSLESNVESLVFETLYEELSQSSTTNSAEVFSQLTLVLPSITTQQIEEINFTPDCSEQTSVVGSFGSVYDQLSDEKKKAIADRLYDNLSNIKKSTGSACESGKSSSEWVGGIIGEFVGYVEVTQLSTLNEQFNVLEAASELTGSQLATYLYSSGGLESETAITTVFESFTTISEVHECITQLNDIAADELRSSSQASLIVELTFEEISGSFHDFKIEQWNDWFTVTLVNLLQVVNTTQLETFNLPLPCEYYQEVVKGFDISYEHMSEETRKTVYDNLIKKQLDSTKLKDGVACGDATQRTQEWIDINFGQYVQYAEFTSLLSWNINFFVSDVVSTLSVEQLAEVILHKNNINNEELACQVAGRIQQSSYTEINSFLFQINVVSQQSGIAEFTNKIIEHKLLSSTINGIKSSLPTFTHAVWSGFITAIKIFFRSMDKDSLTPLLDSCQCEDYPLIVSSLNEVYDSYSGENQEILFQLLFGFLDNKHNTKGSACTVSGESSSDWLGRVLAKFSRSATLTTINGINPDFNGLQAISVLTPTQVGELAFYGNVLTNTESANIFGNALQGYSYNQVLVFLDSFNANAETKAFTSLGNNDFTSSIANTVFSKVTLQFSSFTNSQIINFWSIQYNLLAGSITAAQIGQISYNNVGCSAYQSIISTLSKHYASLSSDTQDAGYLFGKTYLLAQKQKTGSACTSQISGSAAILQANLGAFLSSASYQELINIFGEFILNDAIAILSEKQLAYCTVLANGLRDTDKMKRIMSRVGSLNTELFLSHLNQAAEENGITQLPNADVRNLILGETFCQLSGKFLLFSAAQYSSIFSSNFKLLLSGLNAKTLGFLPTDLSCESLSSITQVLISQQNLENPEDVYNFIDSVLQHQLKISGSACTGGLSSREWILKYYGSSMCKYASWSTLSTLNIHIVVTEVTDLLSESQLASASVSSTIITSVSSVSNFFISFPSDPTYFIKFLGNLRLQYFQNSNLFSNKVRETIFYKAAETIFPTVATMTLSDWENCLSTMDFLLSTVNSTILEHLSLDIPCTHYQSFIKVLDDKYTDYSLTKKQQIYQYAKSYLSHQATANGSPCEPNTGDISDIVNNNLRKFCRQSTVSDIQQLYPDINPVSYSSMCFLDTVTSSSMN